MPTIALHPPQHITIETQARFVIRGRSILYLVGIKPTLRLLIVHTTSTSRENIMIASEERNPGRPRWEGEGRKAARMRSL
jgi:hypothetical protein